MVERRLKTRLFELEPDLKKLSRFLGISISELYRIREGKRGIGEQVIISALTAFPWRKFEELFYIEFEGRQ